MASLSREEILRVVRLGLEEDIGGGDVTSLATVPGELIAQAKMVAREPLVLAGLELAVAAFQELSSQTQIQNEAQDGALLSAGQTMIGLIGPTRAILAAERVALNFVQRLSGIASLTAQFVAAVQGTRAQILDTRKTTPGWRRLEKYAVTCGGGRNRRMGLYDQVLIKDNHLAALRHELPNAVAAAIRRARAQYPKLAVEVEADTVEQAGQAAEAGADIILLDNMDLVTMREAVKRIQGRARIEASGGVNLATVRAIAETGVDYISVGALTHSARAMDIGLDI